VNNLNDQQLLELCRDGDDAAFGVLVERHQDRLFHSLVSMLKSHEDAVDIVQEAFFQAHRKLDTFRGDSAFYTWLYRIATNRALSFLRKQKLKPTSMEGLNETSGFDPPASDDHSQPLKMVLREEHRQLVRETLDELTDDYRVVLVMKEFEGLRYDEIAELTENPIGTVRSRIHRGRIELADRLKRKLEIRGDAE
jgi:RNA polymerase sigma-70 factor (ECF subfamily)